MDVQDCDKTMMYTVFEDNNGSIELDKRPKMRPQTKHVVIKCHRFLSFVAKGVISMLKVNTVEQEADFLTNPLPALLFNYLRGNVLCW